ncbi:hypothetical protein [Paenibacillus sp. MMO-58]|uniref:hypothetical protein n=1 Tax=Paenibacillus sp. MMO-58 TaxID=3081290 RepID=UPI00301A6793
MKSEDEYLTELKEIGFTTELLNAKPTSGRWSTHRVISGLIIGELKLSEELGEAHLYLDDYFSFMKEESQLKKSLESIGIQIH